MHEVTLSRKYWSPTADETKPNVFRGDIVEGIIISSTYEKPGRDGKQRYVDISVDDTTDVSVKLHGYLGQLWDAVKPALNAGEQVKFLHAKDDNGRSRFKLYVDREESN